MFRRWLNDNPPFYPAFTSFILNRKTPILIDTEDLMSVYLCIPHLRNVIDKKAEMFKNMELRVRNTRTGELEEDNEILALLKQPNVLQIQEQFFEQYSILKDIYANAFIYLLRGSSLSDPVALWNLPAGEMEIIPTGKIFQQTELKNIIEKFQLTYSDGDKKEFPIEDVIYIAQGASNRYYVGESKILSLRLPISNIEGALKTRNVIINDKGAIGILSSQGKDSDGGIPLDAKEKERLEKHYRSKYGLGDDQNKIIMTTADVKWNPISYPTKDLLLFEEIEDDFAAICGAYGMARDIFPSTKGATFENQKQAYVQTYQNTIQPEADLLMRMLSDRLGLTDQGLKLEADYSWLPVMQADKQSEEAANKSKAETLSIMLKDGVITKEQYAQQFGVDLVEQEEEQSQLDKILNAQVELRGTVGGVDGIISINQAVAAGQMTRASAINVLVNVYGYDQAVAASMITDQGTGQ
jgi:phage portal protein BeeE